MTTKKTILALSPTAECVLLAARIRGQWTDLVAAGGYRVEFVLGQVLKDVTVERLILMVYGVHRPLEVRSLLQQLQARGVSVIWCCPAGSASVTRACQGLSSVRLVTGKDMRQAVDAAGLVPTSSKSQEHLFDLRSQQDLKNYLDYKISMALFGLPDTQPIQDAAQFLADLWAAKDKFSPSKLSNADAASVKRFSEGNFPYLAGYSPPLQELKRRIKQVGKTDLSVLVIGETGTGKENVACYLHEFSQRREKPLLALNCAGLTETFLRSELFGHVKGAYTGADTPKMGAVELAEGGTLFLDEVAEMPLSVQAALLRFLQNRRYVRLGETVEKTADVRVIAATQPDLEARMQDGRFRRDLYFRLAEVTITTPALREVPDDIQHVTDHILFAHRGTVSSTEFRRTRQYFTQGMGILRTHPWPGNVRELSSLVRRKLVLDDDVLAELGRGQNTKVPSSQIPVSPPYLASIRPIDDILREYVEQAFQHRGALTQQQLAKKLGKSVNTIKKILRP